MDSFNKLALHVPHCNSPVTVRGAVAPAEQQHVGGGAVRRQSERPRQYSEAIVEVLEIKERHEEHTESPRITQRKETNIQSIITKDVGISICIELPPA